MSNDVFHRAADAVAAAHTEVHEKARRFWTTAHGQAAHTAGQAAHATRVCLGECTMVVVRAGYDVAHFSCGVICSIPRAVELGMRQVRRSH